MINKKTDGLVWLPTKKTSLVQKSASSFINLAGTEMEFVSHGPLYEAWPAFKKHAQ